MPDTARSAILDRLRANRAGAPAATPEKLAPLAVTYPKAERLVRLRRAMEAVKTEFLDAGRSDWPATLHGFLVREGVRSLAYGPASEAGRALGAHWPAGGPTLVAYDRPVEEMKSTLFDGIDAGFTGTRCGIAQTGSLVLWPSPEEPRLLSLVPPIHVALLDSTRIHDSFADVLLVESWASTMPANALLVSGPSKTADIEQTLAYGVHGPKRLVVVVV